MGLSNLCGTLFSLVFLNFRTCRLWRTNYLYLPLRVLDQRTRLNRGARRCAVARGRGLSQWCRQHKRSLSRGAVSFIELGQLSVRAHAPVHRCMTRVTNLFDQGSCFFFLNLTCFFFSGRAPAKSSISSPHRPSSKPALSRPPRMKSPTPSLLAEAVKSPAGPGRPRCPHRRVDGERSYDAGVVVAICADGCGSKLKRCPDCCIWENYK